MALSLISLNVEWDKHLATVLPFLKQSAVDVVCIQELLEQDIPLFEEICGPLVVYSPVGYLQRGSLFPIGCGIFSKLKFTAHGERYYVGARETIRMDDEKSDIGTHVLSYADFEKEGASYRIITTHFTWSQGGEIDDAQRKHLAALFVELDTLGEFALTGDFNAPRGRETFAMLAERYKDNIPEQYEFSLDPDLHTKAGHHLPYMVDGLFTTPSYKASDVSLTFGVSDHAAIVATIEKAP